MINKIRNFKVLLAWEVRRNSWKRKRKSKHLFKNWNHRKGILIIKNNQN